MTIPTDTVLEHASFRLSPDTDTDAFVAAAAGLEDFLRSTGNVQARYLARDETGLWNDLVIWTSRDAAEAAFETIKDRPEFLRFVAPIDGESLQMRHPSVLWQMTG